MPQPLEVPSHIRLLAQEVRDAGGRAWLVGGGVRDHLLDKPVHDWDLEVFGLEPSKLKRLLRSLGTVNAVGRAFGVFKLRPHGAPPEQPDLDISIPRRDNKVGPGHRGIAVQGDPTMSLEEAARRRDLTLNAILLDPLTQEIADPFHGQRDLAEGRLRAVDPKTFLEDPLRALRVVQFAARLQMTVDPSLVALCRQAPLEELPAERIQGEWAKLLLVSAKPSLGLQLARQAHILPRVFPELTDDDPAHTDAVVDHLVITRDALQPEGRRWAIMLGGWLHHASPEAVTATLDRLWLHRWRGYALRDQTLAAIAHWADPHDTDAALRHLSTHAELALTLPLAAAHHHALSDSEGEARAADALQRAHSLGIATSAPTPWLKGRDLKVLGLPPGPAMGRLLKAVYTLQLDGKIHSTRQALDAARSLLDQGPP